MHGRSRQGSELGLSGLSGNLLFILTVVSAYVPTLMAWPHALTRLEAIGLLAAGAVYVLVDIYDGWLLQRSAAVAYFAIQIPLGAAIIYMSHSPGWIGLVMLPLVAKSVGVLPRCQMLIVCALIVVAEAVVPGLRFGRVVAVQSGMGFLAGTVFTVVLMHVVARERKVRVEVERLAAALREANRQLEAASHYKSEFLANMSHELRTPLNAIIGFTRLVMRRSKDVLPTRQYENLEKILLSAEHLLGLINDILDLSKIEAGRIELHPVEFALVPLVEVCLRTVEPLVKSEQVRLVQELETNLPALVADQDKVKQILLNLLSNAVKATAAGTITVTARRRDGEVTMAVADTGTGIPEEALERIFEEFRQVESSTSQPYSGTGLGLPISRRLARLMGGDLTVQSTVGVGSPFTVTLPLGSTAAPPTPSHEVLATARSAALPE
jgi:signal transduction histidine kinase